MAWDEEVLRIPTRDFKLLSDRAYIHFHCHAERIGFPLSPVHGLKDSSQKASTKMRCIDILVHTYMCIHIHI
jgi:hypothetical protein